MTTDNKTLADVHPGGRVRLGGQAELDRHEFQAWARELLPCPFCGNGAEFVPYKDNGLTLKCKSMGCIQRNQRTLRYGIDWLRTSMAEHWNTRALSAQPSPVGQGGLNYERMFVDACAALAEVSRELGCDPEQGGAETILAAIAELRAALAARQPVGQIPAEVLSAISGLAHIVKANVPSLADKHVAVIDAWLYAGLPAQTADNQPVAVRVTPEMRAAFRKAYREGGFWADRLDTALDAMMRAAAPAQVVDLERFRGTVKSQYSMTEWMHRCGFVSAEKLEESKKNHDHLLALIDSQAVGK